MSQVLFRLSRWENLEYAEKIWPGYEGPCGLSRGRSHLGGKYVDASRVPGSSSKVGGSWHTARQWTQQARRAGNIPEPVPEDLAAENARLRRENQELRDTNELLKAASAFSASELDPKRRK